ncbi:hypothetical protein BE04_07835 [Sorangium cellulosum]|uniref:Uncharacterized protein n=1 Tax=Sorangium cellulosum TaxID=56 RepID=A0A150P9S7_SORCE|nr:hypothetical protein BE04_07835 [Sorangium cellulosum]
MSDRRWLTGLFVLALGALTREARGQGALVEAPAAAIEPWTYVEQSKIVVPLLLKTGATLEPNSARTVRVRVGEEPLQSLLPAFKTTFVPPARIEIDVDVRHIPGPTTYTVAVELGGLAGDPRAPTTQIIELTWTLPAARLAPIAPIVVRDTLAWPSAKGTAHLLLRESSGKVKLTGISLSEPEVPVNDGVPADMLLQLPTDSFDLSPGEERLLKIVHTGTFPVGKTTGKIQIRAPQLVEPVVVPYEVHTRIHDWAIVMLFLSAGLVGWLVRKRLIQREELARLRADFEQCRAKAEKIADTYPEAASLRPALAHVEQQLRDGATDAAREALNGLLTRVAEVLKARSNAIASLLEIALPVKQFVDLGWKLPHKVDLSLARAHLAAATQALREEDFATGKKMYDAALSALDEVGMAITGWKREARAALKRIDDGDMLSKAARAEGGQLAASAAEKLKQLPDYNSTERPEWQGYLRHVHNTRWELARLLACAADAFKRDAADAVKALRAWKGKDSEYAMELEQAATLELDVSKGEPVDGLGLLLDTAEKYKKIVEKYVTSSEARALLGSGDYAGAIAAQMSSDKMVDVKPHVSSAGKALEEPAPADSGAWAPEAVGVPAGQVVVFRQSLDPVVAARAELGQVRFVQAFVSAAILSVAAWVLYRGSWVGTVNDVVGIFVAGFFTDFTLEAVLNVVPTLKKT